MPDLEPITRDEKLWSGEDLEPKTRREMYIKHLYDETQVIPDKPITREEIFILKAGEELHDVTIEQLNVTENGTYSEAGKAYSPVIVNVPQTTLTTLDVTENGTYTAPSGTAYNEVEVDVPLPENAYLLKDIPNTPTAIATFSDGANLPMPKLEVAIEPQQDLHGYDAPWVGGAGKNKVDVASGSTTTTVTLVQKELNAGTYTYSTYGKRNDGEHWRVVVASQGDETIAAGNDTSGTTLARSQVTFTLTETTTIRLKLQFLLSYDTLNYERVQLESGSTATTYAPYSNICPISGWSAVDVNVSGVNVWDEVTESGRINTTTGANTTGIGERSKNFVPVKPNTSVYIKADNNCFIIEYDSNKDFIRYANYYKNETFTTGATTAFIRFYSTVENGLSGCSINYPSTDTEYHAYNGNTYTIDLDGTRYGGKLDVVSGVLSAVPYYASYNGETLVGEWISDRDKYEVGTTPTIGAQVVNIGATPTTIQLTPTQVSSLLGVNNVWADCGDITDGQYFGKEV